MLTRSEVARRLGRSIATVRRLEGKELHPERDGRGIYRFDEGEVDGLAERLTSAGSISALDTDALDDPNADAPRHHRAELDALNDEILGLRRELISTRQRAHEAERRLDRYKLDTAQGLLSLAREMTEFEPRLGETLVHLAEELGA